MFSSRLETHVNYVQDSTFHSLGVGPRRRGQFWRRGGHEHDSLPHLPPSGRLVRPLETITSNNGGRWEIWDEQDREARGERERGDRFRRFPSH